MRQTQTICWNKDVSFQKHNRATNNELFACAAAEAEAEAQPDIFQT